MRASLVANAVHLGSILFILDDAHEGNRDVIGRQCQNVPVPRNCLLSRDPHVFNIACERYSLGLSSSKKGHLSVKRKYFAGKTVAGLLLNASNRSHSKC